MNLPNPFPGLAGNVNAAVQISTPDTQSNTIKFKKAGKNGTLIAIVLDESGSMGICRDTTIVGFNEFVQGQKATEATAGAGYLTLVKFEGGKVNTVYQGRPLSEVPALDHAGYTPMGGTNLLDAIGETINSVNAVLAASKKKDRPGVIITIMTDGEENSSRRFNNQQIKDMVAAAERSDWTFTFLGANIDAFSVGSRFGMTAANSVNYSTANMGATMASVSASTMRQRVAKQAGVSTEELYSRGLYTTDELKSMK